MADNLTPEQIETNAAKPRRMQADGQLVEQHSIPDQIAADRHAKSTAAAKSRGRGIILTKLEPPGTV